MLKVGFQQRAKKEGDEYEDVCANAVVKYGLEIIATGVVDKESGVRIDIVTMNPHGLYIPFECKGGEETAQKKGGFKSSDNVKKAIGTSSSLYHGQSFRTEYPWTPMICLTKYMSDPKNPVFRQIAVIPTWLIADVLDDRDSVGIKRWANMDWYGLEVHKKTYETMGDVLLANRHWNLKGR